MIHITYKSKGLVNVIGAIQILHSCLPLTIRCVICPANEGVHTKETITYLGIHDRMPIV